MSRSRFSLARRALVGGLLAFSVLAGAPAPASAEEQLTLSRALKLAKQRAPEMKNARARVALANGQLDVAKAPYYPTLTATGSALAQALGEKAAVLPPRTTPVAIVNYTTGVLAGGQLRWTLYDFGRTGNAVDAAEAGRDAAASNASNAEANLIETVANAYLDVVYGDRVKDIQQGIVEDRERLIQVVKGLVKQGLSPAVEELRAQARLEAARRDYELGVATVNEARVGLLAFLGLDARTGTSFATPRLPRLTLESDAAIKEAEEKRPSVVAAKSTAAAEQSNVDSARARYYPSIGLQGDASYRVARLDVFDQWLPTRTATGSLILTVPLFDMSISGRLNVAKAQADAAAATYEQAKRDARTEAAKTVVALATSEKVREHAKKAAESSAAVLAVIRARYQQGISSMLDLIEAETSDAEARLAAVRADRAVDSASVRLLSATGRAPRLLELP